MCFHQGKSRRTHWLFFSPDRGSETSTTQPTAPRETPQPLEEPPEPTPQVDSLQRRPTPQAHPAKIARESWLAPERLPAEHFAAASASVSH
jgi:hypothetical protein